MAADEALMIYCKFQTAQKKTLSDTTPFVNEATVNGETANATIEFV